MRYFIRELLYWMVGLVHRIRNRHLKMEFRAKASVSSRFEGYNKLSHHSYFSGSMGYGSYVGEHSNVTGTIGRFCSIAGHVTFLINTHPVTGFVSSHPCFYSTLKQVGCTFVTQQKFDETPKLPGSHVSIEVGNDVYIGHGATIIGPVKIGDGAVIAANATVTHDVAPYTIVGGTPAKVIKKRFSDDEIDYLLQLQWWNKDLAWIKQHAEQFQSVSALQDILSNETTPDRKE